MLDLLTVALRYADVACLVYGLAYAALIALCIRRDVCGDNPKESRP